MFFIATEPFYIPTSKSLRFQFLTSSPMCFIFCCFENSHPNGYEVVVSSFHVVVFYSNLVPLIILSLIRDHSFWNNTEVFVYSVFRILNLNLPSDKIMTNNSLIKISKRFKE